MANRRVTKSGKDSDGDITKLCGDGAAWSPRQKNDAIRDIENKEYNYYVDRAGHRTDVHVVNEGGKKYLRTTKDSSSKNNLDNLPSC